MSALGLRRVKNEDNLFANGVNKPMYSNEPFKHSSSSNDRINVFAVCDGMGGESHGEVAANIAVDHLKNLVSNLGWIDHYSNEKVVEVIQGYVEIANRKICDFMKDNNTSQMGTTLAGVVILDNEATIFGLGDSRIYLLRNEKLIQVSKDHTHAQKLLNIGVITEDELLTHPSRNKLAMHLGIPVNEGIIEADIFDVIEMIDGDRILICSDGITEHLRDENIQKVLMNENSTYSCADKLISETYERGATDNTSCIVIDVNTKNHVKNLASRIEHFVKGRNR